MPKVHADFWAVLDDNDRPFDFASVLIAAGELDVAQRMKIRSTATTDYLYDAIEERSGIHGTAVRFRNENWPGRGHLVTGELNALTLPPEESITEEMGFYFDNALRVLVTQRQQFFKASAFAGLIRDITGSRFFLFPILRRDAWQRFQRLTRLGSIEIKVRGSLQHPDLSRSAPSMGRLIGEAVSEIQAVEATLRFSMGRTRKQSLARQAVRRLLSALRNDESVEELAVTGNEADNPSETVDFMHDRLVFSGQVGYEEKHLSRTRCRRLLRDAIERHREYLESRLQ